MLFVHNTSRVDGEKYPNLLREKGFSSFPTLCFLDGNGNMLVTQHERTVRGFKQTLARLAIIDELKRELAEKGGLELERKVFLAEVELQSMTVDEIKKRMEQLALQAEDRARADAFLVDAELRDLRSRSRQLGTDAVTEAIVAIAKAGRRPTPEGSSMFWQVTLGWCSKHGDPELAQTAFDALDKMVLPAAVKKRNETMLEQAKAVKAGG